MRVALRGEHVARDQTVGPQEAHVEHPRVGVDLREVAAARIGDQHDDDVVGTGIARDGERRVHRGSARPADQQALVARDAPGGEERVGVADLDDPVDDRGSNVVGQKSSPMPSVRYGRPVPPEYTEPDGIGADDLHSRVLRLQEPADAGDRPAGSDAGDEVRDTTVASAPRSPGPVVRSCARGFAAFEYWSGRNAPGVSRTSRSAVE